AASARLHAATRRLAALRSAPATARSALDALEREQDEAQAALAKLSEAFRLQRARERPSPETLAKALPEGAVLVDYLFFDRAGSIGKDGKPRRERRLAAFLHRRGRASARIDLGPAAAVESAADAWRPLLLKGDYGHDAGEKLKALAWTPLEKHLRDAKLVLVSPDGVLGTVPFAALPGKKKGTCLVEDILIAVVPVPSALPDLLAPAKDRLPASLLVVGGVDYDAARKPATGRRGAPVSRAGKWGALPGTAAEAEAVSASFAKTFGAKAAHLTGGAATSRAVRAALPKARYAHFATHGFFAPEEARSALEGGVGWNPLLLSGLAFAGANRDPGPEEDSGILTALEVSEMDLTQLDLAVLSACETGLGKVAGGEGVLGMQRAFQIAGARSVVASLWSVDDEATRQLMGDFYAQAWDGKTPMGEALGKAQLAMLFGKTLEGKPRGAGKVPVKLPAGDGKRLPPFYWAAFVLSGDWR
ncbi:MAG: CHAT domain-containing protein, partial [Gemmataceae bacterium]|nr:CHAT domain-containing protein [Gemmataceae bacterium]